MKEKTPNWKPVQRGKIYCSPACGYHCTLFDHTVKRRTANKLAKRLGKGWKSHLWENFGWCFNVTNSELAVHQNRGGGYTTFFNGHHQFVAHGNSPEESVIGAIEMSHSFLKDMTQQVKNVEHIFTELKKKGHK